MEIRVTGDLVRISDFTEIVRNTDAVIHLAARVHMMRETASDPDRAFGEANTDVTRRLAQAAANSGIGRFVFLSSVKVNGEETSGIPYTERDTAAPEDAYGRSKRDAEVALREIAAATDMAMTILRVPLVYGPHVRANFAALMRICDTSLPLPLDGVTGNRRSLLYLGNLTHALETIVETDSDPSGTYLLSDGEDMSTAGLVRYLRQSLNRHPPRLPVSRVVLEMIAGLAGKKDAVRRICGSLQIDSSGFRQAFDWTPPYSAAQGIAATAAAHRANP